MSADNCFPLRTWAITGHSKAHSETPWVNSVHPSPPNEKTVPESFRGHRLLPPTNSSFCGFYWTFACYSLRHQLRVYFLDSRGMNLLWSLQISSVHTPGSWLNLILTSPFIYIAMNIMALLWAILGWTVASQTWPIAYFSCQLDQIALGMPSCLCALIVLGSK